MLNRLSPETTKAVREIHDGVGIPMDLPLGFVLKSCFGRAAFEQTIKNKAPRAVLVRSVMASGIMAIRFRKSISKSIY